MLEISFHGRDLMSLKRHGPIFQKLVFSFIII